jgi:hypothetical protein
MQVVEQAYGRAAGWAQRWSRSVTERVA